MDEEFSKKRSKMTITVRPHPVVCETSSIEQSNDFATDVVVQMTNEKSNGPLFLLQITVIIKILRVNLNPSNPRGVEIIVTIQVQN